jgi:hypothetical protein
VLNEEKNVHYQSYNIADLLQQHSVAAYPPEIPEVRTRIFDELTCD